VIRTVKVIEGWLPIPADLADQLGWHEGDLIEVDLVDQTLIITKAETPTPSPGN
jgi:AbrB family looped-hinge helix DNA binding protein